MVECQFKGLYYNCDEKYFTGHKCKEKNYFMAISEDVSEEEVEAPLVVELLDPTNITLPLDPPDVEPIISLNYLTRFSAPQTLKLIGYIKNHKVIIVIDSGNTHNFIITALAKKQISISIQLTNFKS
jgi:hypothetical protein